jgi:hypothetical protein
MKFVNYHLNTGIDHMFLFFSDPDDPALEALSRYNRTTCIRCDTRHWQDHNLTADSNFDERQKCNATTGFRLARKSGFNWMIHMDVDELIFSRESIPAHLAGVSQSVKAVRIPVFEAVPEKTEYNSFFEEVDLFKVMTTGLRKYRARLAAGGAFFRGEYFRGHSMGKAALRTNAHFSGVWAHGPIVDGEKMLPASILSEVKLLHFDSCTFEAWKTKWGRLCETGIIQSGLRKNRIKQFESFAALYSKGDFSNLEDLYRQMYFLSDRDKKILNDMGLLKRIHLDGKLFSRLK